MDKKLYEIHKKLEPCKNQQQHTTELTLTQHFIYLITGHHSYQLHS